MPLKFTPILPPGSTILVTGANGLIGSHICDQFLNLGYHVRGTVRSPTKSAWLSNLFDKKYGPGKFTLFPVPDMVLPDAYLEAIKGVDAVIHTASVLTFDTDPQKVIPPSIAGVINALEAASQEPSVKRFVLTSSSLAATTPKPNVEGIRVTADSWNDEVVQVAYTDPHPPYVAPKGLAVYAASKTLQEREAWKFMEDKTPGFVLNAVLPNINFGASLDYENQGHASTSGIVEALFKGDTAYLGGVQPQYFVDVQDVALLHVAATIHPDVNSERIFAFAEPVNADTVLAILRRLYPDREFIDDYQPEKELSEIVPRQRAEELLREVGQDGGWTSLEESIRRNTYDIKV